MQVLQNIRYMQLRNYGPKERKVGKRGYRKKYTSDADDLGARESAATMMELEIKKWIVIIKLYKIMRKSRLAVNNDKTQIMCLASKRKRVAMAVKREVGKMKITVEGHKLEEMEHRSVLGLTWNRKLSWKKIMEKLAERFNTR